MVEIIPKSFEEIPSWQRNLLYFLIFLLIAIIVGFFVLRNLKEKSEKDLDALEERLSQEGVFRVVDLEKEIFDYKRKLEDFSFLFENHILNTKFFDFMESKTHPQVFFSETNLKSKSSRVSLYGLADSFLSLGQQISIFKQEELVKDVILSDVSISKKGGIEFNLDILFKEELFRYSTTTPINKD